MSGSIYRLASSPIFVEVNWTFADPDFKPSPDVTEEEDIAIQDHIYKNDDYDPGDDY